MRGVSGLDFQVKHIIKTNLKPETNDVFNNFYSIVHYFPWF